MKKLIVAGASIYGAFALSRAMPSAGFYLMLLPTAALLAFLWQRRRAQSGQARHDRARMCQALEAVRSGMTYAQASHQYGIPERAIRRYRLQIFHLYFD